MGETYRQRIRTSFFERGYNQNSSVLRQGQKHDCDATRSNRKFAIEFREKPLFALQEREKCMWVTDLKHATFFPTKELAVKFCKDHFLTSTHYKIKTL